MEQCRFRHPAKAAVSLEKHRHHNQLSLKHDLPEFIRPSASSSQLHVSVISVQLEDPISWDEAFQDFPPPPKASNDYAEIVNGGARKPKNSSTF